MPEIRRLNILENVTRSLLWQFLTLHNFFKLFLQRTLLGFTSVNIRMFNSTIFILILIMRRRKKLTQKQLPWKFTNHIQKASTSPTQSITTVKIHGIRTPSKIKIAIPNQTTFFTNYQTGQGLRMENLQPAIFGQRSRPLVFESITTSQRRHSTKLTNRTRLFFQKPLSFQRTIHNRQY